MNRIHTFFTPDSREGGGEGGGEGQRMCFSDPSIMRIL